MFLTERAELRKFQQECGEALGRDILVAAFGQMTVGQLEFHREAVFGPRLALIGEGTVRGVWEENIAAILVAQVGGLETRLKVFRGDISFLEFSRLDPLLVIPAGRQVSSEDPHNNKGELIYAVAREQGNNLEIIAGTHGPLSVTQKLDLEGLAYSDIVDKIRYELQERNMGYSWKEQEGSMPGSVRTVFYVKCQ